MQSETSSTVRQLRVEEVAPRQRRQTEPSPAPTRQEPSTLDVLVAAFTGLGYALSARGLLLLSLIGAFVLAMRVMDSPSPMALAVLVAYAAFTVVPVAYLEVRRRQ